MVLTAVASTIMSTEILNTKPIHTNITKSEHLALENLRKDKDHIIVTADKGVALVVMDKTEYITKCEALLQENSVYQHLSRDTSPTIHKENVKPSYKTSQFISISPETHLPTIHKELVKILQDYKNNSFISQTEYTQLRPHGTNSPAARFYGPSQDPQKQHAYASHNFSLWHSNIQHCQIHH